MTAVPRRAIQMRRGLLRPQKVVRLDGYMAGEQIIVVQRMRQNLVQPRQFFGLLAALDRGLGAGEGEHQQCRGDKRKDEQDGPGAQRIPAGSLEQGTHAGGSLSGCFAPP